MYSTIIWHMDDLKISHVSGDVVEDIIKWVNERFRKVIPLTTSMDKVLEYLGPTLDFSVQGKVIMSMYNYVQKLVEEAPDNRPGKKQRRL